MKTILKSFFKLLACALVLGVVLSLSSCKGDYEMQCPMDCCTCDQEPGGTGNPGQHGQPED